MINKIFQRAGYKKVEYSAFDLSREQNISFDPGFLVPTLVQEILPGDEFMVNSQVFLRFQPMLAPIMGRWDVTIHYFFVPNRQVWSEWEEFITGGKLGTSAPVFPKLNLDNTAQASKLTDYLGLPTPGSMTWTPQVSALPFRAYLKIWNDYYRDENLQTEIDVETATQAELITLRKRSYEKDYFTSALTNPQRTTTGSSVPATVNYLSSATATPIPATTTNMQQANVDGKIRVGGVQVAIQNIQSITMLINDLRKSSAIQRWLEKSNIGGYRYNEIIKSNFDVVPDDQRLQRPQYLGGGKAPVVISEVLNTTGTAEAPQGDMTGHAYSTGSQNRFKERFKEHGYVIGIMSVMPKVQYFQGIPKHFSRFDKFDYPWPEMAHLGEEPIINREIYLDPSQQSYSESNFGFQQRYADCKYGQSTVHGDFRTTLDFWTNARKFATPVYLNNSFVESNIDNSKIFAVPAGDNLLAQIYHDVKARRPLPYFADPRLS